jgi:hypothetical protein
MRVLHKSMLLRLPHSALEINAQAGSVRKLFYKLTLLTLASFLVDK